MTNHYNDSRASRIRSGRRTAAVVALCVLVSLAAGWVWRPAPTPLPGESTGDADLAARAVALVGRDRPALAVACVTPDAVRTAAIGAARTDRFEIGSISKGLTGLLLADMIDRGEVSAGTRLGDLLPATGAIGDVTLRQLATHTSGLPTQLPTVAQAGRNVIATLTAGNPYGGTPQQRLDALVDVPLDSPPGTYSNLGFELLGAALAAAADRPYRDLLAERILRPSGLSDATVPYDADELTERDLLGQTHGGRTNDAWLGEAMAPAGGVRADIDQLAAFAQLLLRERAPGIDALEPKVSSDGEDPIGWAWMTTRSPVDDRAVVWHNGGTGGFTAYLGLDRERRVGVVIMSAKGEPPNPVTLDGFQLLHEIEGCA